MTGPTPRRLTHRYREVPQPVESDASERAAARRGALLPALALAHVTASPVDVLSIRDRAGASIKVLVGAPAALVDRASVPPHPCLLPPGATVTPVDPAAVARACLALRWVTARLELDPSRSTSEAHHGHFVEDHLANLGGRPFAFGVSARPAPATSVEQRRLQLANELPALRLRAQTLALDEQRLHRASSELELIEGAAGGGLWLVDVHLGAPSDAEARALASLFAAPSDLAGLPVRLGLGETTAAPMLVSAEIAAGLLHPPSRELPGLRVPERATFDLTLERTGTLRLGDVLDANGQPCGPLSVATDTINRHVFVTGSTGSGKSQTVRRLLGELSAASIPWMVVEPSKSEYASMATSVAGVTVIRPGDPAAPPAGLNPLEPAHLEVNGTTVRFPLQTHVDLVRSLFTAAFEATEPFPQVLSAALTGVYERLGWDLAMSTPSAATDWDPRFPTLADLQAEALNVVDAIGYGDEVRGNIRGVVNVRLSSLRLGSTGSFFECGRPLDVDALLRTPTVLEIEDVGTDADKAFLMGTLVIRIVELLRLRATVEGPPTGLRHVLVLEEAHRLLRHAEPGTATARAVEMFADMLAEVRAYGEGLVVAEQIPSKVIPDVVKNTALKIVHRLPAADDRAAVGATMNLSEQQSRAVVAFPPGVAALHTDGMDRPVRVRVEQLRAGASRRADRVCAPSSPPSTACPPTCATKACTLAELHASRRIAADGELAQWAELTVIAHVTGRPMPAVHTGWVSDVRQRFTNGERLRCAIAVVAKDVVDRRSAAIVAFCDPDGLTRHIGEVLVAQLRNGAPCAAETDYQVGQFRYVDVLDELRAARDAGSDGLASPARFHARGLRLRSTTVDGQHAEVQHAHRRLAVPTANLIGGQPSTIAAHLPPRDLPDDEWRAALAASFGFLEPMSAGLGKVLKAVAPR